MNMKKLYSIGETASILGLSVQMLRNYSNMGLVEPQVIDAESGYRYYSFEQFHFIDRIKYLRSMGVSLHDIKKIFEDGDVGALVSHLQKRKGEVEAELKLINETYNNLTWYIDYFSYGQKYHIEGIPYFRDFPKRFLLSVDFLYKSNYKDSIESVETRLAKLKNEINAQYYRLFGYAIDTDKFLNGEFYPLRYYIPIRTLPDNIQPNSENIIEVPAGTYICVWTKNREQFDVSVFNKFFADKKKPPFVLADEYEDNLSEYHYCPYEIQCLIEPFDPNLK